MPNDYSSHTCSFCDHPISSQQYHETSRKFELPLCKYCEAGYHNKATRYTKQLFLHLKKRNFKVCLEKYDGYKTVDIVVEDAMVHIEVDGSQHNWDAEIAISDLKRTYYSMTKGYYTLRVPNSAIHLHAEETLEVLASILNERKQQGSINI